MASNLSLSLFKNPKTGQINYRVMDTTTGNEIYQTSSYNVARDFVRSGRTDPEIIALANQQTINYEGGVQTASQPATETSASVPTLTATDSSIAVNFDTPPETLSSSSYSTPDDFNRVRAAFAGEDVTFPESSSQFDPRIRAAFAGEDVTFPTTEATPGTDRVRAAFAGEDVTFEPTAATPGVNRVRAAFAEAPDDVNSGIGTRPLPESTTVENYSAQSIGTTYATAQDPDTGLWYVYNTQNSSDVVAMDLSAYQANQLASQYNTNNPGTGTGYQNSVPPTLSQANAGPNASYSQDQANQATSMLNQARNQATVAEQRNQSGTGAKQGDWRVRLRLAPSANYLYKDQNPGILAPLLATDGVIFPYTPTIAMNYSADYQPYDLTHNNYRGYFYKGSRVGEITITADFTAQDSNEADYLLAVITFFKSCTKMFYGQDKYRGSPPPLVFLSGLGQYQFNDHACAISNFAYNLPNDVDYIRARGKQTSTGGTMAWKRSSNAYTPRGMDLTSVWTRLTGAAQSVSSLFSSNSSTSNNAAILMNGAMNIPPAPTNLGLNESTYVPTKLSMTLTLMPMMSRQQVSQQFSLQKFSNGNLIKGGYW